LKNELNWGFHTQFVTPCISVGLSLFLQVFNTLNQIPLTFRDADAAACSYCDIEITFCQLIRHPQTCRYSSASQHEIPVLSTNFTVHFQTYETSISLLTSVLVFPIIFDTISQNKRHKTHLRYYRTYGSRYGETEFLTVESATCLELFYIKLTVRTLPVVKKYSERQTDRQERYPLQVGIL
jgi:hypothetical protein